MTKPLRVEGVREAQVAFDTVGKEASPGAIAAAAAEAILPDVSARSRRDSGLMAESWGVDNDNETAHFVNSTDYWTYQEFGTESVEPQHAITKAWEDNEATIIAAAGEVVIDAGERAGFEQ